MVLFLRCIHGVWHVFQLVGAAFGAAGQRCMALSTVIWVGDAKNWIPEMVEKAEKLRVNAGRNSILNFLISF